jgi:hypothetical protein
VGPTQVRVGVEGGQQQVRHRGGNRLDEHRALHPWQHAEPQPDLPGPH